MMQAAARVLGWVVAAAIVLGAAPRVPGGEPAPGGPQTPETRTLSADEAGQALERDWLFQAMGEEEVRALGDPDFPGIERLPIRPRVATAPVVERP
jgi:hypothetical protein